MKAGEYFGFSFALAAFMVTSVSAQIIRAKSSQMCGPAIRTDQEFNSHGQLVREC